MGSWEHSKNSGHEVKNLLAEAFGETGLQIQVLEETPKNASFTFVVTGPSKVSNSFTVRSANMTKDDVNCTGISASFLFATGPEMFYAREETGDLVNNIPSFVQEVRTQIG